jgi:hypothetical protein
VSELVEVIGVATSKLLIAVVKDTSNTPSLISLPELRGELGLGPFLRY